MYHLCRGAIDHFNLTLQHIEELQRIETDRDLCLEQEYWRLGPETAADIRKLWEEEEVLHEAYHRRHELESFFENAKYWFDNIERLAQPGYIPTLEDILHMRVKTTGIVEQCIDFVDLKKLKGGESGTVGEPHSSGLSSKSGCSSNGAGQEDHTIQMRKKSCSLILTGSQRTERKKWVETWRNGDVSAIFFVVSLSEYNQVLYEDGRTNRMIESLVLFEELVNSSVLYRVPFYLFFNKQDVFLERIAHYDLSACPLWQDTLPQELRLSEPFNSFIPSLFSQKTKAILEQSRALKNSINHDASSKFDVEAMVQQLTKRSKSRSFLYGSRRYLLKHRSSGNILSDTSTDASFISNRNHCLKLLTDEFLEQNGVRLLTDDELLEEEENRLLNLPTDALLQICMFLESHDLIKLGMTCFEMFVVTSSDFVWKALTLSYHPLVVEDAVLRVFKNSSYYRLYCLQNGNNLNGGDTDQEAASVAEQVTRDEQDEDGSPLDTTAADHGDNDDILFGVKSPWRYYYEYSENWYQRNMDFIVKQFMSRTRRNDIRIFVTCAIDHQSLKPILDTVMHEVIFERDGFVSSSPQHSPSGGKKHRRHPSKR